MLRPSVDGDVAFGDYDYAGAALRREVMEEVRDDRAFGAPDGIQHRVLDDCGIPQFVGVTIVELEQGVLTEGVHGDR